MNTDKKDEVQETEGRLSEKGKVAQRVAFACVHHLCLSAVTECSH
jgi:hypothetical protein